MAVDFQRVLDFLVALALLILYQTVGVAAIVVATLASVAINTPFSSLQDKYKDKIMEAKGARLRATTECLKSMRILKIPLITGKGLSALATFGVLQEALTTLPNCISTLSRTRVSLDRLSKFLHEPELQADAVSRTNDQDPTVILVEAADITEWMSKRDDSFGLRNGWSPVQVRTWARLLGTMIENNVCFGSPMNRSKYYRVLEMCQLKRDLEILPFGDRREGHHFERRPEAKDATCSCTVSGC
ncbi:hypothetical protein SELMODRAFT_402330 [Selaginella moellendorffii]|uniref:ABC transmembrane type-1 domain-containing protein n=1 Tax=Selaginella moellendorffii TaxID=88036 RepID=D8QQA8_SELML|nr:hypothetical protein SELMODRAFT_402330 [Selaginella moellendorffii]